MSCAICHGAVKPYPVKDIATPAHELVICDNCRHIQWKSMPSEEEIAAYYAGRYANDHDQRALQEQGRAYYSQHAAELVRRYKRWGGLSDKTVIVDFGCAWPVFLEEAQKSGLYAQCIGVDYDESAIEAGRTLGCTMMTPAEFLASDLQGKIDIIRFSHVIEHMIDPKSFAEKLYPLMAAKGLVYIAQPGFPTLKTNVPPPALHDAVYPEHLHFFNPLSLTSLFISAGFETREIALFQNEKPMAARYRNSFDTVFALRKLWPLALKVPLAFQRLRGGYPWFFGENVYLYAQKS